MESLQEYKSRKEGIVTVSGLLDIIDGRKDELEFMVCMAVDKDGVVHVYESQSNSTLRAIGLIETGKAYYLNNMLDWE